MRRWLTLTVAGLGLAALTVMGYWEVWSVAE